MQTPLGKYNALLSQKKERSSKLTLLEIVICSLCLIFFSHINEKKLTMIANSYLLSYVKAEKYINNLKYEVTLIDFGGQRCKASSLCLLEGPLSEENSC